MELSSVVVNECREELAGQIARKAQANEAMILAFADFPYFLEELLKLAYQPGARLVTVGPVTPEIELAATHADVALVETRGASPFTSDIDAVLEAIISPADMIYVANPNRVTGAVLTLADLKVLAHATPRGTLFLDEFYFDYCGTTGLPLADLLSNVIIIRSFVSSVAISSSDAGFILANPGTITALKSCLPSRPMSSTICKTIVSALAGDDEFSTHLQTTHAESLRLATALANRGVSCRLAQTDFLLLQAADPAGVVSFLAKYNLPVVSLDGYPGLNGYVRYLIQPSSVNDRLLEAFKKMPTELYLTPGRGRTCVTLRRGPERNVGERRPGFPVLPAEKIGSRRVVSVSDEKAMASD